MNQYRSGEYRPCTVFGVKCKFHRWIEEEKLILKLESVALRKRDLFDAVMQDYNDYGVINPGMSTEKIKQTFALVEFEDGHMEKVDPTVVIFDKENKEKEKCLIY